MMFAYHEQLHPKNPKNGCVMCEGCDVLCEFRREKRREMREAFSAYGLGFGKNSDAKMAHIEQLRTASFRTAIT